MNWRTTAILFLILLLLGGAVYWQSQGGGQPTGAATATSPPLSLQETTLLLPDVEVEEVVRLEVSHAPSGEEVTFAQEEAEWTRTVPTTTQVLSSTVVVPLRSLLDAGGRRTLPAGTSSPAAYGLKEPTATITVVARRNQRTVRYQFNVGNLTPAGDAYYLQKAGDPRIHIVPTFPLNNVLDLLPSWNAS